MQALTRHPHRTARFIRRWWWYWTRMTLMGLTAGILIAGFYNQAAVSHFDPQPAPPQAVHAGP